MLRQPVSRRESSYLRDPGVTEIVEQLKRDVGGEGCAAPARGKLAACRFAEYQFSLPR
jgi:hypothetical protein